MNTPARLESALKRLAASLDLLEAAAERRAEADARRANLEEEFTVMQDDRTRVAVELDGALARASTLEVANDDVAQRLKGLGATVKTILEKAALAGK